jgi:hypothetical protein
LNSCPPNPTSALRWSRRGIAACIWPLLLVLLAACEGEPPPLRLQTLTYQQMDIAALRKAIAVEALDIAPSQAPPGMPVLEALGANLADLGIVENSTPFVSGVRAVIPLYRSVLHLLVRDDVDLDGKRSADTPLSFLVLNDSHAGNTFVGLVAQRAGMVVGRSPVAGTAEAGNTEVIVYFGPINPRSTDWYTPGYHLVSLDSIGTAAAEFLREGISLLVPQMQATRIPALTYTLPGNEQGLQTLSVDTLLVTRKDTSESQIYRLTRTLVEQKAQLASLEPDVFSWVSERFDPEKLNFPLHDGARRYFERDEPGLLQRYAETINLLVYLAILAVTGLLALLRWRRQRKKDRVDTFYTQLFSIRERAATEAPAGLLEETRALERRAYRLLIDEKLAADESFRIFTDLLENVRAELVAQQEHAVPGTDAGGRARPP